MVSSGWRHRVGSCCLVIAGFGLWLWGSTRSSSCLAAEVHSRWCRLVDGIVLAVAICDCWVWALVAGLLNVYGA